VFVLCVSPVRRHHCLYQSWNGDISLDLGTFTHTSLSSALFVACTVVVDLEQIERVVESFQLTVIS